MAHQPLFTLRGHGRAVPSGSMSILPMKDGVRFLFEHPRDMAITCVVGLPDAIVDVEEADCSTMRITLVSSAQWKAAWDSEGAVKVTVKEFLERCGVSFGHSWSSSTGGGNINSSGRAGDAAAGGSNRGGASNSRGDANDEGDDRGSNNTGGRQPPVPSPPPSQPSSSGCLPENRVRIFLQVQNEAGKDLEPDTPLDLAKELHANCALEGGLDFTITREENVIPPLLDLELGINADFLLRSQCIVRQRENHTYRVGVLHNDLEISYHGDTRSALSLNKAKAIDVYALEMSEKKTRSSATSNEVGGELNVTGGHPLMAAAQPFMLTGGLKLTAKRMKLSGASDEVNKLRKMDALPNSSFTVNYRCCRPHNGPDVLSFVASHHPSLTSLASLDDTGLSLEEGSEICTSLGKSMSMSVVGKFWMQVGHIHTHTLKLSRKLVEIEVTRKISMLRRITRRKAKMLSAMVQSTQSYKVELQLNHGLDFNLYGGKIIVWVAKSFANPAVDVIDIVSPPPVPPVPQ